MCNSVNQGTFRTRCDGCFLSPGDGEAEPQSRVSGVGAFSTREEGQRAGGHPETQTQQSGRSRLRRYKHTSHNNTCYMNGSVRSGSGEFRSDPVCCVMGRNNVSCSVCLCPAEGALHHSMNTLLQRGHITADVDLSAFPRSIKLVWHERITTEYKGSYLMTLSAELGAGSGSGSTSTGITRNPAV